MKLKVLWMGAVAALALLSCQPMPLSQLEAPSAPFPQKGATGTLKLSVPSVSPTLAKFLGASIARPSPNASRAFIVVTGVDLELWRGGSFMDSISVPIAIEPTNNEDTTIPWTVPVADNYTVHAKIYNGNVSTTQPVLYGETTDTFSVSSGETTAVTIRPIPQAPAISPGVIPIGPSTVSASLTSCSLITADPMVFNWAEEKWFTVQNAASHSALLITAAGDAHSAPVIMCADQDGKMLGMGISGAIGDTGPAYFTYGGSARLGVLAGNTRYVGLITLSDTIGSPVTSNITLSYADYSDDEYAGNDSMDTAHAISSGDVIDGINLVPLAQDSGPLHQGGDWYKFTLAPADDHNILLSLTYDADWAPLGLVICDSEGSYICSATPPLLSGPSNPGALETAQINAADDIPAGLADGTYYVLVGESGAGVLGSDYELKYIAGTGTVDVGLE